MKEPIYFDHKVEVKLSFVETKQVNKKGKKVKAPVVHRTLFLDSPAMPRTEINKWKVVAQRRDGEMRFTTHYWPPLEREAWWEEYRQLREGWKREKEPNGKPSVYNLEQILRWLKWHVKDPVAVLTELLTTPAKRKDDEDEGEDLDAA